MMSLNDLDNLKIERLRIVRYKIYKTQPMHE
jgi:hypothetical protein